MSVPRPEEFVLDVRRAARLGQKPVGSADSRRVQTDPIAQVLQGAALWLTPKTVEHYDPGDFVGWPEPLQAELRRAVEVFQSVASAIPADKAPSQGEFMQGLEAFRRLTNAVRAVVLSDWERAADGLLTQAEAWTAEIKWPARREPKKMEETLLAEYQLQQLQFYAGQHLYVLDPVARFVPGAAGAFDLAIQPSYYVTSLYRYFDGHWYVHLDVGQGVREGRGQPWARESFVKAVEELRSLL